MQLVQRRAMGWTIWGSNGSGQTQYPAQNGIWSFPGAKRQTRGADHPLPLRMGLNYKSVLVDLEACHGLILTLYIHVQFNRWKLVIEHFLFRLCTLC